MTTAVDVGLDFLISLNHLHTQYIILGTALHKLNEFTNQVTVAFMMLVEQGKVRFEDPVAKFLPAFADIQASTVRWACWELLMSD